ncbi:MAG: hypothetical protein AB7V26_16010 [Lysobacterales bacterium]
MSSIRANGMGASCGLALALLASWTAAQELDAAAAPPAPTASAAAPAASDKAAPTPPPPRSDCPPSKDEDQRLRKRRLPGAIGQDCVPTASADGRPVVPDPASAALRVPRRFSLLPRPGVADFDDAIAMPDRWRIVDALYDERWYDPYNRNHLKGDRPVHGEDWFFSLTAISDSVLESRRAPTPVGAATTGDPGAIDVFGDPDQTVFVQNLAVELAYLKGSTVFIPPEIEFRLTPVFSYNSAEVGERGVLNVDPRTGRTRRDRHLGVQAAFVDYHLRNVSEHFDFDSIRVGIQPFNADFRGFLFQDSQLGARLFGTRRNNVFQYNLAVFQRLDKDTNSGLNDLGARVRDDTVVVGNLYWQDLFKLGLQSQFTVVYNRNREDGGFDFDSNGAIVRPASFGDERPRHYDVTYFGVSGDGHVDRLNLSATAYYALGREHNGPFNAAPSDIRAWFGAAELGMDFDWIRTRASLLYASGDDDPFDRKSQGFDAIFENPMFAGADTSYWIRQAVPLIGGGRVALSARNGVLNSLRSSKEQGQSNFTNPGTVLLGLGADFDLMPELRLSFNANHLAFADSAVLETARNQAGIHRTIGLDLSTALIWRPLMTQNLVLRLSYATLVPGQGYDDLFPKQGQPHSLLANVILTY